MKILQVHHRYSSRVASGEDWVVDAEAAALRHAGHDVVSLARLWDHFSSSGTLGLARAAIRSVWNPGAVADVRAACELHAPDLIHIHNTFPTFSPGVFWPAHRQAPTVFTVHNYRAFCAAAVVSRAGRPCFECLEQRSVMPALRNGCYRKSHVSTVAPAVMIAAHRAVGTWVRNIDAFIALSQYQRGILIRAGWPEERIHVKPNFCRDPGPPVPWEAREPVVIFAGRLSAEKGAAVPIEAWHRWGADAPLLRILGSGPEEDRLKAFAASGPAAARIEFLGHLAGHIVLRHIARARLVVVPSVWAETFSLVVGESFAAGTPVAVSDYGALPELVDHERTGIRFPLGDAPALHQAVAAWWSGDRLAAIGAEARRQYEERFAPGPVFRQLLDVYRHAAEWRARGETEPA